MSFALLSRAARTGVLLTCGITATHAAAHAAEPEASAAEATPEPVEPPVAAKPAPYSLPWQLRSVGVANAVRVDSVYARYGETAATEGGVAVIMAAGSLKLADSFGVCAKVGVSSNTPDNGPSGTAFVNPVLGAVYAWKLPPDFRFAAMLASSVPIGSGGGNDPDAATTGAIKSGHLARSALDGSMFAVNEVSLLAGADAAWVAHGFTAQLEVTLGQLLRTRGEQAMPDSARTNFLSGAHLGYFFVPQVSVGTELRYQRWLSTPKAVEKDASLRDNLSFAAGVRFHITAGSTAIRPGVAYARGLRGPMADKQYNVIQLDVPVVF